MASTAAVGCGRGFRGIPHLHSTHPSKAHTLCKKKPILSATGGKSESKCGKERVAGKETKIYKLPIPYPPPPPSPSSLTASENRQAVQEGKPPLLKSITLLCRHTTPAAHPPNHVINTLTFSQPKKNSEKHSFIIKSCCAVILPGAVAMAPTKKRRKKETNRPLNYYIRKEERPERRER